jgi:hypothetical protein
VYVDNSTDTTTDWLAQNVALPAVPAGFVSRTGPDINWAAFYTVFAGGDGILYAVTTSGKLVFFRLEYDLSNSQFRALGWSADSNTEIGCPGSSAAYALWNVFTKLSGFSRLSDDPTTVTRAIWAVDGVPNHFFFKHGWQPGGLVEDYCGNWANNGVAYGLTWNGPPLPQGAFDTPIEAGNGLSYAVHTTNGAPDGKLFRFRMRPDGTYFADSGLPIGNGWNFKFITAAPGEYSIEGYVSTSAQGGNIKPISTLSVAAGGTVRVRASTFAPTYSAQVIRLRRQTSTDATNPTGLINGVSVGSAVTVPTGSYKKAESFEMYSEGAYWADDGVNLPLPADAVAGLYAVLLKTPSGGRYMAPFVVKASQPSARIAVLANVNTWNAYNEWGGASRYHTILNSAVQDTLNQMPAYFSFERPFAETPFFDGQDATTGLLSRNPRPMNHLVRAEVWVTTWLDTLKASDPKYGYDMLTDVDLDQCSGACLSTLRSYKALVITTHPEYWSDKMRDRLDDYLNAGGHLIYLAGNGLFDRVTITDGGRMEVRHGIGGNCPYRGTFTPCPPRDLFRDHDRSERAILGLAYEISTSFKQPTTPGSGAPFTVQTPAHGFFRTGFTNAPAAVGGVQGLNNNLQAAGTWETGQWSFSAEENGYCLTSLCPPSHRNQIGTVIASDGAGSDIVYHTTGGAVRGWVFAAPSITFGGVLAIDPTLQRVIQNALDGAIAGALP